MNRRGFLRGLLGVAAATVTAPLAVRAAMAVLPKSRPVLRYSITFTERIPKTEEELMAYEKSITEFLARVAAQEAEDRKSLACGR